MRSLLRRDEHTAAALSFAAAVVVLTSFVWTMMAGSYEDFAAFLIFGGLVAISVPILRRAARHGVAPPTPLLTAALLLKLTSAIVRYRVAYGIYGGVADASTYDKVARGHYQDFRHLQLFMPDTTPFHGLVPFLNTVIYALVGPTELGAFLVMSWIGFWGLYLFYRAFRIGFPEGDHLRYGLLIFFLPSLLYWPSSVGKEAWMTFAIGLFTYGLSRVLAQMPGGYVAAGAGLWGVMMVRPHVALVLLPAAGLAFGLRRSARTGSRLSVVKVVGLALLLVGSLVAVAKVQSYFGINSLDVQSVTHELDTVRAQTAEGASTYSPPNAQSPLGYLIAVVTMLFRPFPWEVHTVQAVAAAVECVLLAMVSLTALPRIVRGWADIVTRPYLVFAVVYTALFILAFSSIANFGILARERVQVLPAVAILLCIRRPQPAESPTGTELSLESLT